MSNIPPQENFANYPRASELDVDRLELLVNGYLGLNRPFLINFLMLVGLNILIRGTELVSSEVAVLGIVVAILIALLFWLCFGGIGFMVVQGKAMNGIKAFGFQGGLFSTNKEALRAFLETMKARSTNTGTVPPMSL